MKHMENNITPPVETRFKDLTGNISVNFKNDVDFTKLIATEAGFNAERFEPIAIRVYLENEIQVTVYAIDKDRQKQGNGSGKLPVHKFKIGSDFFEIMSMIKDLNFTLSTGAYDLENMEVINK